MSVVSVECCQVEVSAMGRSLVQRCPTESGVSERDRGTSERGPRSTRAVEPREIRKNNLFSKRINKQTTKKQNLSEPK